MSFRNKMGLSVKGKFFPSASRRGYRKATRRGKSLGRFSLGSK